MAKSQAVHMKSRNSVLWNSRKKGSKNAVGIKVIGDNEVYIEMLVGSNRSLDSDICIGNPQEALEIITEMARFLVDNGAVLK